MLEADFEDSLTEINKDELSRTHLALKLAGKLNQPLKPKQKITPYASQALLAARLKADKYLGPYPEEKAFRKALIAKLIQITEQIYYEPKLTTGMIASEIRNIINVIKSKEIDS